MNFNSLVKHIKSQGCRVTIYSKKERIGGAAGLFYEDPPHIKMAVLKVSKRDKVSVLLHEYGHFCQLKDGFANYLDGICWPHNVLDEWVERKVELTEREIQMVRNTMLTVEHDAEMRAIKLGEELKPDDFDAEYHLSEAQSYMAGIKWCFKHRNDFKKRPSWKHYPAKRLTTAELFAPLTDRENKILRKIKAKH